MTDVWVRDVHHVTLTVRDLGASESWYVGVLGLKPTIRREGAGFRRVILNSLSGSRIGLTQHEGTAESDSFSELGTGLDHLSFGCTDRGEIDAWESRLRDAGVATEGVVDAGDRLVLSFRDPDGIALEFFVSLPG